MVREAAREAAGTTMEAGPLRSVSVLGATGSVGRAAMDLILREPERFRVVALTANTSARELAALARAARAEVAVVADERCLGELREALAGSGIEAAAGWRAVSEAACRPADLTVAAIVGAAGLSATLAAVACGNIVALATKECLVAAGPLFTAAAEAAGCRVLPVDSEHNAIYQVFETGDPSAVARVILTASGGPFRNWSRARMATATPAEALRHPNWSMGAKITIDSATLMNKGLELIEAFHLFPVEARQLDVLVHPQSIVHGLVQYRDGSLLAQLGRPDMRTPISYCLNWPRRGGAPVEPLDLGMVGTLSFEKPDTERFPALALARAALEAGGGRPNLLNAANEIAVEAFLSGRIGFLDIAAVVADVLERAEAEGMTAAPADLEGVLAQDAYARRLARQRVDGRMAAKSRT